MDQSDDTGAADACLKVVFRSIKFIMRWCQ